MRCALIVALLALCTCALVQGKEAAHAKAEPHYRLGKAPKSEFKTGDKSYKIDPEGKSTKQIRALPAEHFDPVTRPQRCEKFYRGALKDHYEECRGGRRYHCGPFRSEFIYWVRRWPARLRARWAYHHHIYIDEALWREWMMDPEFAAEIAALQRANTPVEVGYLPAEYASTSPVVVYNDEYLDAVYNPVPFLAVLTLKSLNPDPKTDWIGTAAAESLLSKLSSIPGLFVADRQQVTGALKDQKLPQSDIADPNHAAQIGKAIDVERVVAGSYVADGDKVLFNLRIVDVQTGAVQNGISKTVARDRLLDEMPELATSLAAALGYEPANESVAMVIASGPSAIAPTTPPAAPPRGGSIFDPPPGATPPATPVAPMTPVAPAIPGIGGPARRVFEATDKITGSMSFTPAEGPYEIKDKLVPGDGVKEFTLRFEPGAAIYGGSIDTGRAGHIEITGTAENPVIFRNVEIVQKLGGSLKARYAIFDDCKFRKGGAFFRAPSSKWELDKCLVRGSSTFPRITHVDYGIKLTDCTFSGMNFEDTREATPKDNKPMDYMLALRKDWRTIDRCRFEDCTIPPTIFWCATASDYSRCKFIPGVAFESDTPTDVTAFVTGTAGDAPDAIAVANPPKRAALRIIYAPRPFPVFAFPSSK